MKKLFLILILNIFFFQPSFAFTQQEAIDNYLSNRKLERIEGIWIHDNGTISAFYKSGSAFISQVIRSGSGLSNSGDIFGNYEKGSGSVYYGTSQMYQGGQGFWGDQWKRISCEATVAISSDRTGKWICNSSIGSVSAKLTRLWPENFRSHNAKFEKNSPNKSNSKVVTASSGTAFFITDKGHLVTNHHVVDGCKDKSKIVYKDKEYPVKLLAKDKLLDFALLKADISRNKFIVLSDDPPKKLQRIIAAGYPLGKYLSDDLKFTSGIISSLKGMDDDSTLIQIDAALNKGNSGGPIVNEETGELVAVAVAGLRKDKTEAVNFGIKTNSLKNFLDANQIKTTGSKMLFSFGNANVSNILEESTVYTFCK